MSAALDHSAVDAPIHEPATMEYLEQAWHENADVLHPNVTNRLCSVERCLAGINTIVRLMSLDERNAEESKMEETRYNAFSPSTRWGLRQALLELTRSAQGNIEEIREREWIPPNAGTRA